MLVQKMKFRARSAKVKIETVNIRVNIPQNSGDGFIGVIGSAMGGKLKEKRVSCIGMASVEKDRVVKGYKVNGTSKESMNEKNIGYFSSSL